MTNMTEVCRVQCVLCVCFYIIVSSVYVTTHHWSRVGGRKGWFWSARCFKPITNQLFLPLYFCNFQTTIFNLGIFCFCDKIYKINILYNIYIYIYNLFNNKDPILYYWNIGIWNKVGKIGISGFRVAFCNFKNQSHK
jgi:hypothetical protein